MFIRAVLFVLLVVLPLYAAEKRAAAQAKRRFLLDPFSDHLTFVRAYSVSAASVFLNLNRSFVFYLFHRPNLLLFSSSSSSSSPLPSPPLLSSSSPSPPPLLLLLLLLLLLPLLLPPLLLLLLLSYSLSPSILGCLSAPTFLNIVVLAGLAKSTS